MSARRRDFLRYLVTGTIVATQSACFDNSAKPPLRIAIFDTKGESDAIKFKSDFINSLARRLRVETKAFEVFSWFAPYGRPYFRVAGEIARVSPTLVVATSARAAVACEQAMPDVPIVFRSQGDPRQLGLVVELSRPARNSTGIWQAIDLNCKRLELLSRLAPKTNRVSILIDQYLARSAETNASMSRCRIANGETSFVEIVTEGDIANLKNKLPRGTNGIVVPHTEVTSRWPDEIVSAVGSLGMPAVFDATWLVEKGALASIQPIELDEPSVLARLASNLLRGIPASMLPIEVPKSTFVALNLRTARQLQIDVPTWLIKSVDRLVV